MRTLAEILTIRNQWRRRLVRKRMTTRALHVLRSRPFFFVAGCIVLLVPAPGIYRACGEAREKREHRLAETAFQARKEALANRVGNFAGKDIPINIAQWRDVQRAAGRTYVDVQTQRTVKVWLVEGVARNVAIESPGLKGNSCWPRRKGYLVKDFRRQAITVPASCGHVSLNLSVASNQAKGTTDFTFYCWTDGKRWVTESPHTQFKGWSPAMSIWIVGEADVHDEVVMKADCEKFIQMIMPGIVQAVSENPL